MTRLGLIAGIAGIAITITGFALFSGFPFLYWAVHPDLTQMQVIIIAWKQLLIGFVLLVMGFLLLVRCRS